MGDGIRALSNARASLTVLANDEDALRKTMRAAQGMSGDSTTALTEVQGKLGDARRQIEDAVAELSKGDIDTKKGARKSSVKAAETRIAAAETARAEATAKLVKVAPNAGDAAAGAAINAAAGVLANAGKALENAKVAARQSNRQTDTIPRRLLHGFLVIAVWVVVTFVWARWTNPSQEVYWSAFFAWVVVVGILLLVIARNADDGILGPIIGQDKRLSTSKTQVAIWTIAVGFGIAFVTARVLFSAAKIEEVLNPERLDEYLILLGGPFAAGVLAKLTTAAKVDNGTLQKTDATETKPGQLFQDDSGNTDLVDSQYLMFNLIVLGYFLIDLARTSVLPEIPTVLLGLTSAAAVTYTANKAIERNAPIVTAVSPKSCLPGDQIHITGRNFTAGVEDPDIAFATVLIDGYAGELHGLGGSTDTDIVILVPTSLAAGSKALTVRTQAKVTSAPFLIDVLDYQPIIFGLNEPAVVGKPATIVGRNLRSLGAPGPTENVGVTIGGLAAIGEATDTTLTFDVPDGLTKGSDVALTVSRAGSTSLPITVHLKSSVR